VLVTFKGIINKKDGYRQWNVRQFLQSAYGTIWLPQESHAGMSLPSLVFGWRHLATSRESKAHFGLPWVRPWDNRGKCYMDGKRIQCSSNALQHIPIYLQLFPVSSKVRHFSTFFCTFWPPGVRSWDNRGKCYIDGKKIQCWSSA